MIPTHQFFNKNFLFTRRTEIEEEEFSPNHPLGQAVRAQREMGYRVVCGRSVLQQPYTEVPTLISLSILSIEEKIWSHISTAIFHVYKYESSLSFSEPCSNYETNIKNETIFVTRKKIQFISI